MAKNTKIFDILSWNFDTKVFQIYILSVVITSATAVAATAAVWFLFSFNHASLFFRSYYLI